MVMFEGKYAYNDVRTEACEWWTWNKNEYGGVVNVEQIKYTYIPEAKME